MRTKFVAKFKKVSGTKAECSFGNIMASLIVKLFGKSLRCL